MPLRGWQAIVEGDPYGREAEGENTDAFITRFDLFSRFDHLGIPTLTNVLAPSKYYSSHPIVAVSPLTGVAPSHYGRWESIE